MTRIKRPAAAAGAAVLLAFSLSACGGSPTDASKDDFCEDAAKAFNQDFASEPSEDQFEDFKDDVANLGDTGTPDGIPEDARNGFEVFVEAVDGLDYDDVKNADEDETFGIDEDDEKDFEAFFGYVGEQCTSELGVPEDSSS